MQTINQNIKKCVTIAKQLSIVNLFTEKIRERKRDYTRNYEPNYSGLLCEKNVIKIFIILSWSYCPYTVLIFNIIFFLANEETLSTCVFVLF